MLDTGIKDLSRPVIELWSPGPQPVVMAMNYDVLQVDP